MPGLLKKLTNTTQPFYYFFGFFGLPCGDSCNNNTTHNLLVTTQYFTAQTKSNSSSDSSFAMGADLSSFGSLSASAIHGSVYLSKSKVLLKEANLCSNCWECCCWDVADFEEIGFGSLTERWKVYRGLDGSSTMFS